ncbi:flagellar basal-body MS-ring/collar protein FliF [Arvimicrobium flavum]|uniref:flagellar basal-body MS-ring/collar protein FliF n=1 Tax=Arvimicrobium flavum TaxID=3393320 RepID=UPI00237BE274|nr:flagellar basal-body MS-ring/collar protein FliF [Mesorhizobium shangrilense]
MPEQLKTLITNLQGIGPRRLAIMGGVAALVLAVVIVGSLWLNRPAYETLYVGLERQDVNQIGMVLGEAGIEFDVASDGTTVMVAAGKTSKARMLLAEKGLPTSANAGYELFDNVGSLGLTSFMQEITRVRALEGEIARTIQTIAGIRAARVHLVMPERASFRRDQQQPSASVVVRTAGFNADRSANAIRHLVAAAVPGLDAEKVTILDSNGTLLAAGDDPLNNSANRNFVFERSVEMEIEENIRRALAPYLGPDNFRASVKAEVNTDTRQTEETIFDPESRVERSVQVVRANENASQKSAATPATVEENLPESDNQPTAGPESSEASERKEETTNYEMNTKRIATTSNGYSLTKMSVAVVVNQQRLANVLGPNATPDQVGERIAEIQKMVASATGFNEGRGDVINVSAVEFIDGLDGVEIAEAGIMDRVGEQAGTLINAAAFIVVAFLLVWFGLKPMTAALAKPAAAGPSFDEVQRTLPGPDGAAVANDPGMAALPGVAGAAANPLEDLRQRLRPAPQDRLARMVDLNEERTAQILRKWARQEAA